MLIKAKNFMKLEDLTLNLNPGFNVITGPSNQGKSSIIKALESLFYNNHTDSRVMQGKDSYIIGVQDNNNTIMAKRNPSKATKTVYSINNNTLTKVNRGPIKDVEELLNIKEIDILGQKTRLNFSEQFGGLFLLDKNPSQLYDFLATSDTSNKLNDTTKSMKNDLREIIDNQKRIEGQLDIVKQSYDREKTILNNLQGSEEVITEALNISGKVSNIKRLEEIINSLESKIQRLNDIKKNLVEIEVQLKILKDLDNLITQNNDIEHLKSSMLDIANKLKEGREYKSLLSKLNKITNINISSLENEYSNYNKNLTTFLELESLISRITHKENTIDKLKNNLDIVNNIIDSNTKTLKNLDTLISLELIITRLETSNKIINSNKEAINNIDKNLDEINKELSKFKTCPLCGSEL